MAILVFAEAQGGVCKKSAFEAVTYGRKVADALGTECIALTLGQVKNAADLGIYGAQKVLSVTDGALDQLDSQMYTSVIAQAVENTGANVLILSHSSTGKSVAGRLSVRLKAGLVSGVNAIPETGDGFSVRKSVFSGKAMGSFSIDTPVRIISLMGNAVKPERLGSEVAAEPLAVDVPASKVRVKEVKRVEGTVPLPEAEIVVSAGRGLKDPANWGIVEELAEEMKATLACSRPVADAGWRPHHEHVGQTGIAIRPNLYIAIGISGAIQHLAGVNNSKVIVVINKDSEAPFFKAADYGVNGDLFEVVPRLTAAYRKFKETHG